MNLCRSKTAFIFVNILPICTCCFSMQYKYSTCGSTVIINGMVMNTGGKEIIPSDEVASETYAINDVNKVKLTALGTLLVYQQKKGNPDSLEITANQNILPYIAPHCNSQGTLTLGLKDNVILRGIAHLVYTLRAKELSSIKLSGCGDVRFMEQFESPSLTVGISGNGKCRADSIVAKMLKLKLSGNGSFNFNNLRCVQLKSSISGNGSACFGQGFATNQEFKVSGNGHIFAAQLTGNVANLEISGSGKAEVNIDDTLTVRAHSRQSVINNGRAIMTFEKISSGGSVVVMGGSGTVTAISGGIYIDGKRYW